MPRTLDQLLVELHASAAREVTISRGAGPRSASAKVLEEQAANYRETFVASTPSGDAAIDAHELAALIKAGALDET